MSDESSTHRGDDDAAVERARQQVEAAEAGLWPLSAPSGASSPLDLPATASTPSPTSPAEASFAGYQILREIHRGGQGVVYQAVQKSTKRKVAVKVLLEGPFASEGAKRRFEREIDLIAQLKHASIITIFDSGTTADGRQFFAMDYVRGLPLHHYVREQKLTLAQTLKLFAQVCEAVQYAHQKGVIHRDLKPGNILVDSDGVPKVLDFGLAKQMANPIESVVSLTGHIVGTLPYMSPEQARGNPDHIDTRTDVYALGVILYQLLTGHYPYPVVGLIDEVLRHIRDTPPTPPSRAWRADSGVGLHGKRKLRPGQCPIDDEVQTIVLKALSKERERRYQSAGELAKDVAHYLAGEPIDARRDSGWYVLKKQLRKYKVHAAVAGTMALLITAGLIVSFALWQTARVERDAAIVARQAEADARAAEEQQRRRAEANEQTAEQETGKAKTQAAIAGAANKFLAQMLAAADRGQQQGREDVTVREVLDLAAAQLESGEAFSADEFKEVPPEAREQVEAAVRDTIGRTYEGLGLCGTAEPHLVKALDLRRRVLGPEHPDVAVSLNNLALLLNAQGKLSEAEPLFREALAMQRKLLGDEHPHMAGSLNNLALSLRYQGKLAEAEPLHREALAMQRKLLGDEHPHVATSLNNLAGLLQAQGKLAEAEPLFHESLAMYRKLLGDEHPDVARTLNNVASLLQAQGKLAEAEPLHREALAMQRKLLGDEHPDVAQSLNSLAWLLQDQRKLAEAEPLYREALAMRRKLLGDEHPDVAKSLGNLAGLLQAQGKLAEAEPLFHEALAMLRKVLGDEHPDVALSLNNLAGLLYAKGDYVVAEPLLREALALQRKLLGDEHPDVATSLNNLEWLLKDQGKLAEAEPLCREALAMRRKLLGDEHPGVAVSLNDLAMLLLAQGKLAEAEPLYREALAMRRKLLGDEHPAVAASAGNLGSLLVERGDGTAAEPILRECLALREKLFPHGHPQFWRRYDAMSLLGEALAGQSKFAEAEPLLADAYEHLKDDPHVPPPTASVAPKREALERIIQLYESWDAAEPGQGYADKAAEWRAKLTEFQAASQPTAVPTAETP